MTGWASVKSDLLTYLPTLAGLGEVSNGPRLSKSSTPTFAEVGGSADDPAGGYYDADDDSVDGLLRETGEVRVRFVARTGNTGDIDALQASIDGWITELRSHYKADQTLAGALLQGSTVTVGRVDIQHAQTPSGVFVENTASIRYLTRL